MSFAYMIGGLRKHVAVGHDFVLPFCCCLMVESKLSAILGSFGCRVYGFGVGWVGSQQRVCHSGTSSTTTARSTLLSPPDMPESDCMDAGAYVMARHWRLAVQKLVQWPFRGMSACLC